MTTVRIVPEFGPGLEALEALATNSAARERLHQIVARPLSAADLAAKLVRVQTDFRIAGGAAQLVVSLQPTDLLRDLLAAAGARNV